MDTGFTCLPPPLENTDESAAFAQAEAQNSGNTTN